MATARAGNVIGGGDWALDRLVPDILRALEAREPVLIRNPHAIRPWQHVLEPLSGYLLLAERLYQHGQLDAEGWNFGPHDQDARPVEWIVQRLCTAWGEAAGYEVAAGPHPHEANFLQLDCAKANKLLGWQPRWSLDVALVKIVEWVRAYERQTELRQICIRQIREYVES